MIHLVWLLIWRNFYLSSLIIVFYYFFSRFDVNNIKPKDIVMKTPLIRGKLESIPADSIFSPGGTGVATP